MTDDKTLTVRELIAKLVEASDMDAEVCLTLFNGDPVPVTTVDENDDGQLVLGNS